MLFVVIGFFLTVLYCWCSRLNLTLGCVIVPLVFSCLVLVTKKSFRMVFFLLDLSVVWCLASVFWILVSELFLSSWVWCFLASILLLFSFFDAFNFFQYSFVLFEEFLLDVLFLFCWDCRALIYREFVRLLCFSFFIRWSLEECFFMFSVTMEAYCCNALCTCFAKISRVLFYYHFFVIF